MPSARAASVAAPRAASMASSRFKRARRDAGAVAAPKALASLELALRKLRSLLLRDAPPRSVPPEVPVSRIPALLPSRASAACARRALSARASRRAAASAAARSASAARAPASLALRALTSDARSPPARARASSPPVDPHGARADAGATDILPLPLLLSTRHPKRRAPRGLASAPPSLLLALAPARDRGLVLQVLLLARVVGDARADRREEVGARDERERREPARDGPVRRVDGGGAG